VIVFAWPGISGDRVMGKAAATDGLALWLLAARIAQSILHLISTSVVAVSARFAAFAVQMAIGVYWIVVLI
jgi:hypothetical protein